MKKKNWKYGSDLGLHIECPPKVCSPVTTTAYRFCHSPAEPGDFLPTAYVPGARPLGKDLCCTDYSLSLFIDRKKAADRLNHLCKQHPRFAIRAGKCLASVQISPTHGEATKPCKKFTHFELFEYEGCDLLGIVQDDDVEEVVE